MSAPRALVTGATGFVGSHLAMHLLAQGWDVAYVRRPGSRTPAWWGERAERLHAYTHDGTTEGMRAIVEQAAPDVVFHLASLFISEHAPEQVAPLIEANVLFGAQLLEATSAVGVSALVNTGTAWQHFGGTAEYRPVNLYAATKQAFEDVLAYYADARGLRAVTLELTDTYGPHDERGKLFALLARTAASGETLAMSPGEQLIDLVHADDVVRAFALAADRALALAPGATERFSVTSGEPLPLQELVVRYERATGRRVRVEWGGREYRAREVMRPYAGAPLPGWSPEVPLDAGLAQLAEEGS